MRMSKKRVNNIRRKLLGRLTRRLGSSTTQPVRGELSEIKRILVSRPNHRLGNLLMITPLLRELSEMFPTAKVDLLVGGRVAPTLFRYYKNVDAIYSLPRKPLRSLLQYVRGWTSIRRRRYDLAINVIENSSSGRISVVLANARLKFLGEIDDDVRTKYPDHEHMAKKPVYGLREFVRRLGFNVIRKPVPVLDIMLTPEEIAAGAQELRILTGNRRRTIALYTYATGTKCYNKAWWSQAFTKFRDHFLQFNIIEILPVENVSLIDFQAPSFYSKDLRQIASLIHNVEVFIGADSGMVHLASAAQGRVIGLFKFDNMETYRPYNDGSIGVNTNDTDLDTLIDLTAELVGISEGNRPVSAAS
jgi:heptosyltransferase-3